MAISEISIPYGEATPDVFGQSDKHLENLQDVLRRLHLVRSVCRVSCTPCGFGVADILSANIHKVEMTQLRALDSALCAAENSVMTLISLHQMRNG